MKIKETYYAFKRGYNRPARMPLWKLLIVYCMWIISLIGYIAALHFNFWFVIIGIIFQTLAMRLPIKWDTETWRETEKGKQYIEKYENDEI